jgi:hypothetical protein
VQLQSAHSLARWSGVLLGVIVGTMRFVTGLQGLFSLTRGIGWLELLGGLCATMTLLPLALLGIFRPRLAGYSLLASLAVTLIVLLAWGGPHVFAIGGGFGFLTFTLFFFIPYVTVAGLLLYSGRSLAGWPR